MSRYSLRFLGTWQVKADGEPVTRFRGDKVRAMLAYLVVESDRAHRRGSLARLLWPGLSDDAAARNLSQGLVRLRQAFGARPGAEDDPLIATRDSVRWRPAAGEADVLELTRLAASADLADLERAAALYLGEFLAGFSLRDGESFEEWLLVTRERLKEVALRVLREIATRQLAAGHPVDAAGAARRELELDPWREDAYRQLMRALALNGERAGAMAVYDRCREVVRADLGTEPDEETRLLAERIEAGEVERRAPGASPPAAPAQPRHNLPAPLTPIVGRRDELARLEELLQAGARLVTVVGAGGVGKTRLALAAGWAARAHFPDGVWWVTLASLESAGAPGLARATLADAIAAALQLTLPGQRAPLEELATALRGSGRLLLLDNCEHLPEVEPVVRTLLEAAPRLRLLVTSRAPLGVRGEALLPLRGLPVPVAGVAEPASYAGVQLFLERVAWLTPGWTPGAADLAGTVRLCGLLEGMPLGIELAAQWVGLYSPDEIADELQIDLDFLASRSAEVPDRQRSLRAAFGYSWRLLRPEEQRALAALSVFRGSFDREAAQEVAGVRPTTLVALSAKSLVEHAGVGHYRLHELLRQFSAERMVERGEAAALGERHTAHYLALAERAAPQLVGPDQAAWMARLDRDRDNLLAALAWARDHETSEVELRLAGALAHFWVIRGHTREGGEWLRDALTRAEVGTAPALARARACHGTGLLANLQGAQEEAVRWLEEGVALYREVGDPVSAVRALNTLGGVEYDQDHLTRAAALWDECLTLARAAGDSGEAAWAMGNLGEVHFHRGDLVAATACQREALGLARLAGRADLEALHLSDLGNLVCRQGDLDGAAELFRRALAMMRRLGDRRRIAMTLENVAGLAAAAGRARWAARLLGAVDAARLEMGAPQPAPEKRATAQSRAAAEAAIGAPAFAAAFTAGRDLSLDQALAEVLDTHCAANATTLPAGSNR